MEPTDPEARPSSERVERIALGIIAVFLLPVGLQAAFMPQSFFDDFPLGRSWIATEGAPYNEHLTRDVGGLFLALIVVTLWMVWRRGPLRPLAIAWLLQGVLHLVYHGGNLDGYDTIDKIGLVGTLVVPPALACVALWAGRSAGKRVPQ